MTAFLNERDRVPPVVFPRNRPAMVAMVLLGMLAVPDRLGADQGQELPTFRHRAVVLDYADLTYNPCNDVIVPSVVETDHLRDPLGRYYMCYAPHDAPGGICLAYADAPEGPWKEYPANPLIAREWAPHHAVSHVSGPHAVWIVEEQKLLVYYHGENDVTRMASTTDGIRFRYEGAALTTKMFDDISEASYAGVFRHVLPGRDNRYVMLLMGNNRGTRRIYLAWSKDGRSWESRRTPLLDPPAGTNQIAQMSPCFLPGNSKVYMYTNVGPRLHQKIAVAVAETPERAVGVSFVAEMAEVAELAMVAGGKRWSRQQEAAWSDDVARARTAWKEEANALTRELTVDRVRSLSRWAKPQMDDYAAVPALADVVLEPIGADKEGGKLVLEGTIDTLPSHHPLVTRWLKVYVLYDIPARKLIQVTFTIRGERLE